MSCHHSHFAAFRPWKFGLGWLSKREADEGICPPTPAFRCGCRCSLRKEDAGGDRRPFGVHPSRRPLCEAGPSQLSLRGRMRVRDGNTEGSGSRYDTVGMRIPRTQIVAAAVLLGGCATPLPQREATRMSWRAAQRYPAGELPIARINQMFARDAEAPVEVAVSHRETRTQLEVTHASIGLPYPVSQRCALDFGDSTARFKDFMECRARFPDAIFCVIVSELVSDDVALHTILGSISTPVMRVGGHAAGIAIRRPVSRLGATDRADQIDIRLGS